MIINFNFNLSKVEFIWQQNTSKYFAVNFLMENAKQKNFKAIIEEVLPSNNDIVEILKKDKNFVVLPDEIMGFGSLEVPTSRWNSNKYFSTRFDLIYNKNKNLQYYNSLFSSNKNTSQFLFASTKKQIIDDIISAFNQFQIKIVGISFYSKVLYDYILKVHGELSKQNLIVLEKEKDFKIYAFSAQNVLGFKKVDLSQNDQIFAKKFVKFAKNNLNKGNFYQNGTDEIISRTKVEREYPVEIMQKFQFAINVFKEYYKNSNLQIDFDKTVLLNTKNDENFSKDIIMLEFDRAKILSSYKKSMLYIAKKWGILWNKKVLKGESHL